MSNKCPRCTGRGDVFSVGGGYSLVDMGGKKIKCPLCMGSGNFTMPSVKKSRMKTGASGKTNVTVKSKPEGVST